MTDEIDISSSVSQANILDYIVDLSSYRMDVLSARFLTFQVKACKNVALYASSSDNKDSTKPRYEIIIGSHHNKMTIVRRRNDASLQASSRITKHDNTQNVLSCNENRPFWISWEAGSIMVGSGNRVGENVLVSLIDPDPFTVKSLGILTLYKEVGEWKVFIPDVNSCLTVGTDPLTDVPKSLAAGWQYYAKCYDEHEACFGCFF